MSNEVNSFDEAVFSCICSLNALLSCDEMCARGKDIMRVSRFKSWLLSVSNFETVSTDNADKAVTNNETSGDTDDVLL